MSGDSNMDSRIGDPVNFISGVEGDVDNYFDDPTALAGGAPANLTASTGLAEDEFVYVIEVIHRPESLAFQGVFSPECMYSRAFF